MYPGWAGCVFSSSPGEHLIKSLCIPRVHALTDIATDYHVEDMIHCHLKKWKRRVNIGSALIMKGSMLHRGEAIQTRKYCMILQATISGHSLMLVLSVRSCVPKLDRLIVVCPSPGEHLIKSVLRK